MGLELMSKVFQKEPTIPLANWLFLVNFYYTLSDGTTASNGYNLLDDNDLSMKAIKADLPSIETNIVTQSFFGSKKSFPIYRKRMGDTTIEFYIHSAYKENSFIINNFFERYLSKTTPTIYHKEFSPIFDQVEIRMFDRTNARIYTYILYNCIPTKVEHQGGLTYEGTGDIMKYSMSLHYDDWSIIDYGLEEELLSNETFTNSKGEEVKLSKKALKQRMENMR